LKKKGLAYEEFKILGCAVEGYSSSHHGGSHRTDDHVMYGQWAFLSLPQKKEALPSGRGLFEKKKGVGTIWFQLLCFSRDYCPTSRKIHLILFNSRIFYVV